jgi:hypothetical protein
MKRLLFPLLGGGVLGLALTGGLALRAGDLTPAGPYMTKSAIESPTKRLVAARTAAVPPAAVQGFVNPQVAPGKVRWHPDFEAACRAARASGKPVLLFQMMGRLDQKFC